MKDPAADDNPSQFWPLLQAFERFKAALWWGEPPIPTELESKPRPLSLAEEDYAESGREVRALMDKRARDEFLQMLVRGKTTAFVQKKALTRVPSAYWRTLSDAAHKKLTIFDRQGKDLLLSTADDTDRICKAARIRKIKILREPVWSLSRVQVWRRFRSVEAIQFYAREPEDILLHDHFLVQIRETESVIEEAGMRGELRASGRNNSGARGKRIPLTPDYWIDHACQNKIVEEEEENTLGPNPVWDLVFSTEDVLRLWPPANAQLHLAGSPPAKPRGRRPTYDWESCFKHLTELFKHHGPLSRDDPDWSHQAHVEKAAQEFFSKRNQGPSESLVRKHVSKYIKAREEKGQ